MQELTKLVEIYTISTSSHNIVESIHICLHNRRILINFAILKSDFIIAKT